MAAISIKKKKAQILEIKINKKDTGNKSAEILNKLGSPIFQLSNKDADNNY